MQQNSGSEKVLRNPDIKVYGKNGPIKPTLWQVLSLFDDLFKGIIILIADDKDVIREVLEALKKNPQEKLIIFAPLMFVNYLPSEAKVDLMALMKHPNVRVADSLDEYIPDMTAMAQELKSIDASKIPEYQTINTVQKDISGRILGTLQHDLRPYVIEEKGSRYREIIQQAREVFDIKPETPDENVEQFILTAKRDIKKVMEGEISGVYCDIDDTIFDKDEKLKEDTLKLIQRLESEGHTITIWTGGDMELAKTRLVHTPYAKYKVVSKYDYAGATAEIVIDNVSPEKFFIQSGISAKKFLRI